MPFIHLTLGVDIWQAYEKIKTCREARDRAITGRDDARVSTQKLNGIMAEVSEYHRNITTRVILSIVPFIVLLPTSPREGGRCVGVCWRGGGGWSSQELFSYTVCCKGPPRI